MPVSPIEESAEEEGLSQDGETGDVQRQEDMGDGSEANVKEEEEEECEEGRVPVGRISTKDPTEAETEEHERTHCPYGGCCSHCVQSRAMHDPHKNSSPDERWRN